MQYCSCGYETHSTKSCEQEECNRYFVVEQQRAAEEMRIGMAKVMKAYDDRVFFAHEKTLACK